MPGTNPRLSAKLLTLLTSLDNAGISLKNLALISLPAAAPLLMILPILASPAPYFTFY
jgi:hypothetical protein